MMYFWLTMVSFFSINFPVFILKKTIKINILFYFKLFEAFGNIILVGVKFQISLNVTMGGGGGGGGESPKRRNP